MSKRFECLLVKLQLKNNSVIYYIETIEHGELHGNLFKLIKTFLLIKHINVCWF